MRLKAACADSFITSPSCPVSIKLPRPGTRVASMNRISPPTGVQARPVATPGMAVRIALSASKRGAPRIGAMSATSRSTRVAEHAADLALELTHAGLARVVAHDGAQRRIADVAMLRSQAVRV